MDALPSEGLPPGWKVLPLVELLNGRGESVDPARCPDTEFVLYSVPAHESGRPERVHGRDIGSTKQRVAPGTVLLCKINPRINRVWFVEAATDASPLIASTEWITFPRSPAVVPDYLRLFLMREPVRRYLAANASGVGGSLMRVNGKVAGALKLPLAPPAEQTRIVAAVNALFEEVEAGEAALTRASESLTQFRASLLHAAYSGELTADWRVAHAPNEAASDLVASIVAKRRAAGWIGAIPETSAVAPLPPGWVWSSLGELFDVFVGATPARSRPEFWGGDIPWVSSGEVAFCTIQRTRETITTAGLANSSTRLHPPGTVLLAMIGEGRTRGQAAILDVTACNNQNSAAVRVSDTPIPPRFVYHWLTFVYEETRRAGAGGNQPALNKERVRSIAIPVPPLAEMEEILSRVDAQLSEATLPDLAEEGGHLRQAILQAAFTGRLVPQDPADEPATALLARLRAAPAATRRPRQRRTTAQPDLIETEA